MLRLLLLAIFVLQTVSLAENEENENFNFKRNVESHSIKYGETLARIAIKNNVSVAFLLYLNREIRNPDRIQAGIVINVPNETARLYIARQSKSISPLINQMGAQTYKERNRAIKELIAKDWIAIPVLLQALKHEDVEIRENAKEALREIHRRKERIEKI